MTKLILLTLLMALAACTGRHIDADGTGPQGGPAYKPTAQPRSLSVSFSTVNSRKDRWLFQADAGIGGFTYRIWLTPNLETGQLKQPYSDIVRGSVSCSEPVGASLQTCRELRGTVFPFWTNSEIEKLDSFSFDFTSRIEAVCTMKGKFTPTSPETTWAKGFKRWTRVDAVTPSGNNVWYQEGALYDFSTDTALIDERSDSSTELTSFTDRNGIAQLVEFSWVYPVYTDTGIAIRYVGSDRLWVREPPSEDEGLSGTLDYTEIISGKSRSAPFEVECATSP